MSNFVSFHARPRVKGNLPFAERTSQLIFSFPYPVVRASLCAWTGPPSLPSFVERFESVTNAIAVVERKEIPNTNALF